MSDIVVTRNDEGKTIEAVLNDRFEVRLEENPTTGYTWGIDSAEEKWLHLEGSTFISPEESGIGKGGIRVFTFRVRRGGVVSLRLKLRREWEKEGSEVDRFEVRIRAKA